MRIFGHILLALVFLYLVLYLIVLAFAQIGYQPELGYVLMGVVLLYLGIKKVLLKRTGVWPRAVVTGKFRVRMFNRKLD